MVRMIVCGLLGAFPAYFLGLFACLWLLPLLTSNRHDSPVESAMTGAFVVGPLAALAGLAAGAWLARPR